MDKNIKEIVSNEYAKVYSVGSEMHKYCMNSVSDAVVLESGMIFIFKKPSIEKDFCFGYRLSSVDTQEYDEANHMVSSVKNDGGSYFKAYNLRSFERFDNELNEAAECPENYFVQASYNGNIKTCTYIQDACRYRYDYGKLPENAVLLTANDVENLKKVNASEKEKFEKRLNTYLKKYGTSKLHSWSYWSEA